MRKTENTYSLQMMQEWGKLLQEREHARQRLNQRYLEKYIVPLK